MTRLSVAVVIPTIAGREKLLERALLSVRTQRRKPDQLVVEHDVERTGAAPTRNRAVDKVKTDVIAWLDDDDTLQPNHLMANMRVLERDPKISLVYPVPRMVGGRDPTATSVQGEWVLPWGVRFGPEQAEHLRRFGNFIPMTHLVRTEAVRAVGGFPIPGTPEWPRPDVEDWGYILRLLEAGYAFEHLDQKTWNWHVHAAHTGGRGDRDR